jgi:hypothetical protein
MKTVATVVAIAAGIITIIAFFAPSKDCPVNQTIQSGTGTNIDSIDKSNVEVKIKK